ncbi:MAG: hypothetical protein ABIJ25_06935 [Pseudomonadota bacterium]
MKKIFLVLLLLVCIFSPLYAGQSTIVDIDGNACMGDDKSRKQTEQAAMADAKRNAAELGSIETRAEGSVYRVTTRTRDMGAKVRGITITGKQGKATTAEFYEETQSIRTSR